jgi:rubrerythrin
MISTIDYLIIRDKYYEERASDKEIKEAQEYNDWLMEEYPFLKFDDRELDILHTNWLDQMPRGWRIAFGIDLCKDLKEALIKDNALDEYKIVQIKEKYGGLRWYDNWSTNEICKVLDKYEELSYTTCIVCGKPAKYLSKGWICPFCEDCIDEPKERYEEIK